MNGKSITYERIKLLLLLSLFKNLFNNVHVVTINSTVLSEKKTSSILNYFYVWNEILHVCNPFINYNYNSNYNIFFFYMLL